MIENKWPWDFSRGGGETSTWEKRLIEETSYHRKGLNDKRAPSVGGYPEYFRLNAPWVMGANL
jgi:hypothetical protein